MPESFQTAWGARVMGLLVLMGVVIALAGVAASGSASPWTWGVLGVFGLAALVATVANFGDRFHLDEEGIHYENVLTGKLGWRRDRHSAWADVLQATEHEGRTWFLEVEGQRRWVLDQLAAHDQLRLLLEQRGIPIRVSRKPRRFGGSAERDRPTG